MRVLLIATNRHDRLMSRLNAKPLPIGLAYVAGAFADSRHTVKSLDLMFSEDASADVEQAVRDVQPDLVGISLRNLSNHSYLDPQWALPASKAVIDTVRACGDATTVCGGPAFSILPQAVFDYLEPDLGLVGDAADTFVCLADGLESGTPVDHLPGLVRRRDGVIVVNPAGDGAGFNRPPRLDDLDIPRYAQAGFGMGVVTKLSSFAYPTHAGDRAQQDAWRVIRPIDEVLAEVRELEARHGLRKVFFIDNAFNVPLPHAKDLCRALIAADTRVHWNTCLAPFGCDGELIQLMNQAGCVLVLMGALPTAPLSTGGLEERLQPALDTCRLCEQHGLNYTLSVTFGEPDETRHTVDAKLDFLRRVKPSLANLRIGVSVLPGTAVAARALAEGLIADEAELVKPTFYIAPAARDWIVDTLLAEKAANRRWNVL